MSNTHTHIHIVATTNEDMDKKQLFDEVSFACSVVTTKAYSTSFSLGIKCLGAELHSPIYAIYGFVRFADEIVDTFHQYDKQTLFEEFKRDTYLAIERKISLNPILNSFQEVVNEYGIERDLIDCFLNSMKMDLYNQSYDENTYNTYILGSAEVVGLMCLHVFTKNDSRYYNTLKPLAMKLGAAFQKINFLRDLKDDTQDLGRQYFPHLQLHNFDAATKASIENEIALDFAEGLKGIQQLPKSAQFGVYVAYIYYIKLFQKIKQLPPEHILTTRVRVNNVHKIWLLITSFFKYKLGAL
jgi:15-cis-phytoene synthase